MAALNLKNFRKSNHVSQQELADYLGIGQGYVSQMERGDRPMPSYIMKKIASNPEWTVTLEESENHDNTTVKSSNPNGDHIEQNGDNNIGKIGKIEGYSDEPALKREIEMLREQIEELKAEKAAYWEMIKSLTGK